MDYTVDSFVSKMIKAIACIAVLMMVGGVAFFRSYYAIGFALGVGASLALNIIKIIWLKHCVNRATAMEPGAAGAYIGVNYLLRFILTGLVLTATHFLPVVNMFGAVVGLLSLPFANYAVHFFNRGKKPEAMQTSASDDSVNEDDSTNDDASTENIEEGQLP